MGDRHSWVCILSLVATSYVTFGERNVHIARFYGEHSPYTNSFNPHNDPEKMIRLKKV